MLRHPVLLCSFCRIKFNPKRHQYRRYYSPDHTGTTSGYEVNGQCDACKEQTVNMGKGVMFVAEEVYPQICIDPNAAKRRWRAKQKAMGPWQTIQKSQIKRR